MTQASREDTSRAQATPMYGGVLPYPSQWITVFAIAHDDIGALIKEQTSLNISQARFLYEIGYHRSDNRISDISSTLMIQANTSTAILDALIERGFVIRSASKRDGRSAVVDCTPEGRECILGIDKALLIYQDMLRALLSRSEFEVLVSISAAPARRAGCYYERQGRPMQMQNYLSGLSVTLTRLAAISRPEGLSLNGVRMLAALITSGKNARVNTIASRLGIKQNVASTEVTRLDALGFVHRLPDPFDGRAVLIAPSDAGREAFGRIASEFVKGVTADPRLLRAIPGPITTHIHRPKHSQG